MCTRTHRRSAGNFTADNGYCVLQLFAGPPFEEAIREHVCVCVGACVALSGDKRQKRRGRAEKIPGIGERRRHWTHTSSPR